MVEPSIEWWSNSLVLDERALQIRGRKKGVVPGKEGALGTSLQSTTHGLILSNVVRCLRTSAASHSSLWLRTVSGTEELCRLLDCVICVLSINGQIPPNSRQRKTKFLCVSAISWTQLMMGNE